MPTGEHLLPRPSQGKQTENLWLVMTAVPKLPRGQESRTCQVFTSVHKIQGAGLSLHKWVRSTARLACFWLEMENGKAGRRRTLKSGISEVIERPLTHFQNCRPFQAPLPELFPCGSNPHLGFAPKERSPLSLISHCQLCECEYQALS